MAVQGLVSERLVVQIVLVAVLAGLATLIVKRTPSTKVEAAQAAIDANRRLIFVNAIGIDTLGGRVESASASERVVAFLLRDESLQADLAFWESVGGLAKESSAVRLIGYCGGNMCTNAAKTIEPVTLRIISYGEVIASQAVLNADGDGNFILLRPKQGSQVLPWRESADPSTVLQRILQ